MWKFDVNHVQRTTLSWILFTQQIMTEIVHAGKYNYGKHLVVCLNDSTVCIIYWNRTFHMPYDETLKSMIDINTQVGVIQVVPVIKSFEEYKIEGNGWTTAFVLLFHSFKCAKRSLCLILGPKVVYLKINFLYNSKTLCKICTDICSRTLLI